jgi:hypothetical protein
MTRDGAIIFRDLVGKLDTIRLQCEKCGRSGSYRRDRLISRYGLDTTPAKLLLIAAFEQSSPIRHIAMRSPHSRGSPGITATLMAGGSVTDPIKGRADDRQSCP